MSDREKVINDLQMQIEELEERLAIVLEGQQEIVLCKYCVKRYTRFCPDVDSPTRADDWYCGDGKRKEDR